MEGDGSKALGTARLIATLTYVVPLVVFPAVPRMVKAEMSLDAQAQALLTAVLGLVGIVDYGVSLFLEAKMLARVQSGASDRRSGIISAAALVSAFGASLAVYGLVLTFLGAPVWGAAFYVLCAAHGLHFMTRWPNYQRAAEGSPH